jgi:aldose 1-epimerase
MFSAKDTSHPTYNSIPGRYVNRISNAQYTIDGVTYHTEKNDGKNTLHSGTKNWSYRVWSVTALSDSSITFSLADTANSSMGMPGLVNANVTYSVTDSKWNINMVATAPQARTREYTMAFCSNTYG